MRSKPRITKKYLELQRELYRPYEGKPVTREDFHPWDQDLKSKPKKEVKKDLPKTETESQAQIKLCTWMDKNGILFFHPANGGYRNPIEGARFKRSGVKRGVPDLCIPQPRKGYAGLWIEIKRHGLKMNSLTEEQVWWGKRLVEEGHMWMVAFGFEEGKKIVMDYFGMEE